MLAQVSSDQGVGFCDCCLLHLCSAVSFMPRKGWSEAPTEWVQIVRGPRPKSAKWPLAAGHSGAARSPSGKGGATAPVQCRRGSQDGSANPTRQEGRGLPPDEVMANARARVLKLEAAIAAVGESDPTCATLREALARAKSQAQERPVADRMKHTNIFIERARKRVSSLQEDVKKGTGSCSARTREVGPGRIEVARRRSPFAGVATGGGHQDGLPGGPTHYPVQFRTRIGTVEGMCGRVTVGTGRSPCQVAEFGRSRRQRAQAAQGFGFTSSRFGSVEPQHHRQKRGNGWAVAQRRSIFCFSQDGDNDRKRRFESSKWQSFQPIVILKGLSPRERAQYGLRGDRVGERRIQAHLPQWAIWIEPWSSI